MTKSIDADRSPNGAEPSAREQAPWVHAYGYIAEDDASGCEYVDDRLRLDE
jgi:hypothetical protein